MKHGSPDDVACEYFLAEASFEECARIFGISVSTARRYARARREEYREWMNEWFAAEDGWIEMELEEPAVLPKLPPRDLPPASLVRWFVRENPNTDPEMIADALSPYFNGGHRTPPRKLVQNTVSHQRRAGFIRLTDTGYRYVGSPRTAPEQMHPPVSQKSEGENGEAST